MARANVRTWLSLDRFAQIIGLNPLYFNQLSYPSIFPNNVCGDIFFQEDYQHSDRVGRETIAMSIQQAELEISQEAGYNLVPDWTVGERLAYPHPDRPGAYGNTLNPSLLNKSVELRKAHIISGGIQSKTLIEAGASVTRQDDDTDGYAETCVVTVNVSITDAQEIRAYYPAKRGSDAWEIRPITVEISGGVANIQFKAWQIAAANKMEALNAEPLDATKAASYETTIDVYRVYNDPQTQSQFLWEGCGNGNCCGSCTACSFGAQNGCFHLRDQRLGLAVPTPGTWNASTEFFDYAEWSACREPDQVRMWYYSGYRDLNLPRYNVDLAPYWEYAVAYYACSKFERPICGCSNVNQFVEKWRTDIAFSSDAGSFVSTPEMLGNRLGTSVGAIYAWKRIQQNGMKVIK